MILKFSTPEAKSFIQEIAALCLLISQVNRFNRLNLILSNDCLSHQTRLRILLNDLCVFFSAGNKLTEQSLQLFLSSLTSQGDGGLQRLSVNVSIPTLFLCHSFFLQCYCCGKISCPMQKESRRPRSQVSIIIYLSK